jgi:nicotinate-nucleotide adenylyltransferase
MRIGILGGTFDPIHLGHLLTAEMTRETLDLQQVLFAPAGAPPHKQSQEKTPAFHRQVMVQLAIADNPHFVLSRVDVERPGPHYTTDTVRLIRGQGDFSAETCFLIIGSDSLLDLPTWHNAPDLLSLCRLAVAHRPGFQPDLTGLAGVLPGLHARLDWVEMPLIGVSSRNIRARVQAGQSIRYQVAERVRKYIEQHRLYQKL